MLLPDRRILQARPLPRIFSSRIAGSCRRASCCRRARCHALCSSLVALAIKYHYDDHIKVSSLFTFRQLKK